MATLLQVIEQFIDKISVTDRQETSIQSSLDNIYWHLKDKENDLYVNRLFTSGSYERDTIIRPLNDIDIFAVLRYDKWSDEYSRLPSPQRVLSAFKNYMNRQSDYEGKVFQDRPCVTIKLSDKQFDILPCFDAQGGGYLIPNYDLQSWTYSYPEKLQNDLDVVHKLRSYKVKKVIKALKYWNRDLGKIIPSYHIEETAVSIFSLYHFTSLKSAIEIWFENSEFYLDRSKFKTSNNYDNAIKNIRTTNDKLKDAANKYNANEEKQAISIWKQIFGREFPVIDEAEAKTFSKAISEGSLKVAGSGLLSTLSGYGISASKGYYGDLS